MPRSGSGRARLEERVAGHGTWPRAAVYRQKALDADEQVLGRWLNAQRSAARQGDIYEERLAALRAMSQRLDMAWASADRMLAWDDRLNHVQSALVAMAPLTVSTNDDNVRWLVAQWHWVRKGRRTATQRAQVLEAVAAGQAAHPGLPRLSHIEAPEPSVNAG